MTKLFYIETVGCQMNVLDSELVASVLLDAGYLQAETRRQADVVIFNTCSVRQRAEDKIYSALGRLKHVKDHHPHKVFADEVPETGAIELAASRGRSRDGRTTVRLLALRVAFQPDNDPRSTGDGHSMKSPACSVSGTRSSDVEK